MVPSCEVLAFFLAGPATADNTFRARSLGRVCFSSMDVFTIREARRTRERRILVTTKLTLLYFPRIVNSVFGLSEQRQAIRATLTLLALCED